MAAMRPPLNAPKDPREARTPMALLPYQQSWAKDDAPVKVIEKSRRIGLSWAEAADTALLAASAHGMNAFYIGYLKEMAQEFIADCASFAAAYSLAAGQISEHEEVWNDGDERKSIFIYTLRFQSGWRIEALSSAPRNLRGKQGRVILDEYAFHSDQKELLKAALALLIWGGQVHLISTHNGADNLLNTLVLDIRAGKKPYSLHRVTFRDAVDQGLYERVCLRTGQPPSTDGKAAWVAGIYDQYGADAEEELDCIPNHSGGAWLSRALIEARMTDAGTVLRWKAPARDYTTWPDHLRTADMRDWLEAHVRPVLATLDPTARSGFGMDFGRSGDLSVLLIYQTTQALRRRFSLAIELAHCPFDQQRETLFYVGERLPRFTAGKLDARGNGQYLAEKAVQKWGDRIEAVMLTQGWYRDHTAPFKAALEDDTVELIRDADHLDDLRAFQVVKGTPLLPDTRTRGQDGSQRHGDAGVAYLLAYAASRAEALAVTSGFQSVPRRGLADEGADDAEYPTRRML